jgi:glycosyltransferase involved in cell wall biosynthesis
MSQAITRPSISIVVPAFNEEGNIEPLLKAVAKHLVGYAWEIVFVDDGSTDRTLEILKQQTTNNKRVKFISFSRNFGHQAALRAGLRFAQGDAIISMDADMQHPPELLPTLIGEWKKGNQVVYTIREATAEVGLLKRLSSRFFYKMINFLSDLNIENGAADFRLLDRKLVTIINEEQEADLFLRGYIDWLGFKRIGIPYKPAPRFSGSSKYTYKKMFSFAAIGITQFSIKPLRLAFLLSMIAFSLSVVYAIYGGWIALVRNAAVPGWLSLVVLFVFMQGIQFLLLGLMGEYLGRTFMQSKHRPEFIINESNAANMDDRG